MGRASPWDNFVFTRQCLILLAVRSYLGLLCDGRRPKRRHFPPKPVLEWTGTTSCLCRARYLAYFNNKIPNLYDSFMVAKLSQYPHCSTRGPAKN